MLMSTHRHFWYINFLEVPPYMIYGKGYAHCMARHHQMRLILMNKQFTVT